MPFRSLRRPRPRAELPPHHIEERLVHGELVEVKVFDSAWSDGAARYGDKTHVRKSKRGKHK